MKRLWTSSACLLCYARKADAEVVPRWPILLQLDILSSITVVESCAREANTVFNYRSSKVWHRLPSFHHSGQAWKALKDENRVVSRSHLAVTRKILALRSHRERYNRSHTLPPDRRFTLVVEVTTLRCIVHHQVALNRSL